MRFSLLLLRAMLIMVLIANGIGTAFAGTQMMVEHLSVGKAQADIDPASGAPCDEHPGMAMPEPSLMTSSDASTDTEMSGHGSPDCCQSTICQCACLQQGATTAGGVYVVPDVVLHATSVSALVIGHSAPALPQLIRPPIS